MTSDDLTPDQIAKLMEDTGRHLRYLVALCDRMRAQRWPMDDPIWTAAEEAREASSRLYVLLHGMSVGHGRGGR
jgi:hypothetical protein